MALVSVSRIAFQWQVELTDDLELPEIEHLSADRIVFKRPVSHALLARLNPGCFALRVAKSKSTYHHPKGWSAIEKKVGFSEEVILEWASDAERANFARDLLIARTSELFSPAGV
tara:strand:- start:135 stop:479 length:345 start_codon:yes stop_codon:yes gene_type:complete